MARREKRKIGLFCLTASALLLFRDGKVVGTSVGYVAKPELEAFLSGR